MIQVLKYTSDPINEMGKMAGICWNADLSDDDKNFKRGVECLESGHYRVSEYPDVTIQIEYYSARMIRELYTHIIGVTRLQESTRYVECGNFEYYVPNSIQKNRDALNTYIECMMEIQKSYKKLVEKIHIPVQDTANLLPLGMFTKVVLKINCRALMHMAEIRTCTRAYEEFRKFMKELISVLSDLGNEWKYFCENYMKTKCNKVGYCNEKNSCGKSYTKKELEKELNWGFK